MSLRNKTIVPAKAPLTDEQKEALTIWIEGRQQYKNVTTFGADWLKHVSPVDGKVHCSYNQIVNTGRYSCNNPNLQNLPGGYRRPSRHREFLIPGNFKNGLFCIADYSGQELAIMAAGSEEQIWLDTLRTPPLKKISGLTQEEQYVWKFDENDKLYYKDLHAVCASVLFADQFYKTDDKGRKHFRKVAKTINFSIGYGGGPPTVSSELGITHEEAYDLIVDYKATFKQLNKWLNQNGRFAVRTGTSYSFPPFNRMRKLDLEPEDWRRSNIGKNNPIQATAADMVKLSMWLMYKEFKTMTSSAKERNLKGKWVKGQSDIALMIHQLHDELITECDKRDADKVEKIMVDSMREACTRILGEPLTRPAIRKQINFKKDN